LKGEEFVYVSHHLDLKIAKMMNIARYVMVNDGL